MARYFPMPYPDESIYSIFARYDKDTGNDNYFATVKALIGKMYSTINYSFVNGLDFLCQQLPETSNYIPEYFINKHTLLPMYKPFILESRYLNAINNLKCGTITVYTEKTSSTKNKPLQRTNKVFQRAGEIGPKIRLNPCLFFKMNQNAEFKIERKRFKRNRKRA